MAISISAILGFSVKKQTVNNVVQNVTTIKDSVINLGPVFNNVKKEISELGNYAKWAAIGTMAKQTFDGIGQIVGNVTGNFKKVFDFANGYASSGDKIAKTSRLVGMSVKDYQAFSSAAQHAGMSTDEMDGALKKFNVNLGKARSGDSKYLEAFEAVLPKDISSYKTNTEIIAALAESYANLESSEQKAFVSQEIFGRSGLKMSELLGGGYSGIKQLVSDFESHGGGWSEEGAKAAEDFDDRLQDMRETFESVKIIAAQELIPSFSDLFMNIRDLVVSNMPRLKSISKDVGNLVSSLIPVVGKISSVVFSIFDAVGPIGVIVGGMTALVLPLVPPILMIASYVYGLLPLLSSIVGVISGGLVIAVGGVLILFIEIVSIVKQFYDNWDMWCSFVNHELTDAVNDWVNMFVEDVKWLWNGFKYIFIDPFVVFFTSLPDMMSDLWQGFKDGISQIGSFIYNTFFGSIASAINGAKDLLKSLPLVGGLFADSGAGANVGAQSQIATAVQQSYSTTTNRFAVDFQNMPQGVRVTPPDHGDFDWSRSYTLAGAV